MAERSNLAFALLASSFLLGACGGSQPQPRAPEARASSTETSGETIRTPTGDVHDFDYLVGNWNVVRRRLKERGVGSNDWETYSGTTKSVAYLGGMVNVEESESPGRGSGATVNVFDLAKRQWSIYEINGKVGKLENPNVGGFTGNRGEFYGEDEDKGRPIKVRYIWTKSGPDTARWEQAFSYDGGRTWETNRTSDFTRAR
ncbi:hypothetical protein [Pendulispora albinea]|uniref:DUF1579 domain-containing protein n=1 Tax=Pendulispora albinea TaxID=2741071 RepID=A0ABZ2LYL3_9BACT